MLVYDLSDLHAENVHGSRILIPHDFVPQQILNELVQSGQVGVARQVKGHCRHRLEHQEPG